MTGLHFRPGRVQERGQLPSLLIAAASWRADARTRHVHTHEHPRRGFEAPASKHRRHRGLVSRQASTPQLLARGAADEKGQRLDETFTCASNKALGVCVRLATLTVRLCVAGRESVSPVWKRRNGGGGGGPPLSSVRPIVANECVVVLLERCSASSPELASATPYI
ncbi:hypothetical protein HPB50_005876 [Hyalomma asiaticum]|uniref:Uncharacterized protein n=1 Tax=Hyalomma asiaticum TaxID=266040 RepID=A0ACB7S7A9_HYAAI|nr:hypothetical protein HPB50_005876 [Hyalomma asiaticum]